MCCSNNMVWLIYEPEMLQYLCIYDAEQHRLLKNWISKRILLRMTMAAVLLSLLPCWLFFHPLRELPLDPANWALLTVVASLFLSAYVPYSKTYRNKPRLMATNHFLLSLAIYSQLILTFLYWAQLNEHLVKRNRHQKHAAWYHYLTHSLPALAIICNFCVTDMILYRKHAKLVSLGVLLALGYSFMAKQVTGEVSNKWYLRWQDPYMSLAVVIFCTITPALIVYALAAASEILKRRRLPIIERLPSKVQM